LKAGYLGYKQLITDVKAGKIELGSALGLGKYEQYFQLGSVFLQRNETLALHHEYVIPLIKEMEKGRFPESSTLDQFETNYSSIRMNMVKLFVHPNSAGKLAVYLSISPLNGLIRHTLKSTAKPRLTKLLLALRKYQSEKGHLPDSLNKLVPEYLPAIPLDPFSDKPLIWNLKKRVVYSVGQDRIDNGGMIHLKSSKKGSDIGVKLEELESNKGE
jgi:hypothetical protein